MAAQADATVGFYKEVSHAETPDVFGRGVRYAVGGAGDLRVQAGGAGDRSVTVAAGKAWGDAVLAYWTSGLTVLNAVANGGSVRRWDTLVIRRDWSTETATLVLLQGGSTEALAPGVVLRNPSAGVGAGFTVADQPIALVPVDPSSTSAVINGADIRDLRLWSGEGGGLFARHVKARDYIDSVGTQVRIGDVLHTRMLDLSGTPYWDERPLYPRRGWHNSFAPQFSGILLKDTQRYYAVDVPVKPFARMLTATVYATIDVPPRGEWRMQVERVAPATPNAPLVPGSTNIRAMARLNGEAEGTKHHVALPVTIPLDAGEAISIRVWLVRTLGSDGLEVVDDLGEAFRADWIETAPGNAW